MKYLGRKMRFLIITTLSVLVLGNSSLFAQQQNPQNQQQNPQNQGQNQVQNQAQQQANRRQPKIKTELVDLTLNNFENAEDWRAFPTSPLNTTKAQKRPQRGPIEDTYDPTSLTDQESRLFIPGQNHVLGVKAYFKVRGFDRVEVRPPHEYIIRGIGRQLSVWALGRNFRHTLYVKFRDYNGKIYKLRLGRLNYFGWRKLTIAIPGWVPQSVKYSLFNKNLKFVSLFVESDKHEPRGTYYFYFDQLSMKIDKTEESYPGSQLKDLW